MRQTPCDIKGDDGAYHCPYIDTYMGYESEMCRNMCDVGIEDNPLMFDDEEEER